MAESFGQRGGGPADAKAIARAHAVYTPFALAFYDLVVHGLSNRFAWQCPTARLHALYEENLSANHLEAGAGTGMFLDRAGADFERLAVLDINRNCLNRSARRLARFNPMLYEANLLAPIAQAMAPFNSVGLTYVLHCLPGSMDEKLAAIDHLKPLMAEGAVLFGASILGRGITPNPPARGLLDLYNKRGVFNNREDDIESLARGLRKRFDTADVKERGCVALFRAR